MGNTILTVLYFKSGLFNFEKVVCSVNFAE